MSETAQGSTSSSDEGFSISSAIDTLRGSFLLSISVFGILLVALSFLDSNGAVGALVFVYGLGFFFFGTLGYGSIVLSRILRKR